MNPMPEATFNLDCLCLDMACSLPASCFDDFRRLTRTLIHGPAFQWLLVDAQHELLREQVIQALDKVLVAADLRVSRLQLGQDIDDVGSLEARLVQSAAHAEVVHVMGAPGWFDAARWDAFNLRRERIATNARARLVFWLDADAIRLASQGAPDLWAWRSGVYAFVPLRELAERGDMALPVVTGSLEKRNKTERYRRLGEIRSWIKAHPDAPDDMLVALLHELGQLLFNLGDYDKAMAHWRDVVLPFHQRRGAEHEVAMTQGWMADILLIRGQLDEALQLLREEVLPVFERLGNVRSCAITQGNIAEVLRSSGQEDKALHLLHEQVLPVFKRLGDVREDAKNVGNIADILCKRGQFDEALHILREKVLPVFERQGDAYLRAVTQAKIANILQKCGQFDEVLHILREKVLPVFERLGELRGRAVCQVHIAKALQAKGSDDALEVKALLQEAYQTFTQLGLPEADVVARELRQFSP